MIASWPLNDRRTISGWSLNDCKMSVRWSRNDCLMSVRWNLRSKSNGIIQHETIWSGGGQSQSGHFGNDQLSATDMQWWTRNDEFYMRYNRKHSQIPHRSKTEPSTRLTFQRSCWTISNKNIPFTDIARIEIYIGIQDMNENEHWVRADYWTSSNNGREVEDNETEAHIQDIK